MELSKQLIQTTYSTYGGPGAANDNQSLMSQKQIKTLFLQDPKI